jgi:putative heme-binding domain-containing protein
LSQLIGSKLDDQEIADLFAKLGQVSSEDGQPTEKIDRLVFVALNGLGAGIERRGKQFGSYVEKLPADRKSGVHHLLGAAATIAADRQRGSRLRSEALGTLRYATFESAGEPLIELATSEPDQSLRLRAIGTLARFGSPAIADVLLEDFAAQSPSVRRAILDVLLSSTERTKRLLDEIAAKRIAVSELDPSRVKRLTGHRDAQVKQRAAKLLAAAVPADRRKVLADYQAALAAKANAKLGREVFKKNCTACHRIGDLGVNVAPDIADSRVRTPASILTNILDPNRAVDSNYFSYTVVTNNGKVHAGIISAETASSITLRQEENKTVEILRQDIDEMRSSGQSLMPVGLEKNITVAQMADLISYIKNWRYLDGRIPIDAGK